MLYLFFPLFFQIKDSLLLNSAQRVKLCTAQLQSENKILILRISGNVWLGPTIPSSLGFVMGRNSTSNTHCGYFCTLAQSQSHL